MNKIGLWRTACLCFGLLLGNLGWAASRTHLFILSGQSNMARMDAEQCFLPVATTLLAPDRVVLLKVAASGNPIRFWLDEWDMIAASAGIGQKNEKGPIHFKNILSQYAALRKTHGEFASVTLCWMQGERDAKTGLAAVYDRALLQLIANLRRDLACPDLNVVIGRLSDHFPGQAQAKDWQTVRALHVVLANRDPRGAWVDTDDLNDLVGEDGARNNDLHYSPEGYREFGRRLAAQAVRLIRGEAPDSSGRP